ncbi:hypothetical protein [Paenibacillus validus]|uniref:Uncharacterized protein n=1 Tax=Paenibacillus validus TaxID=44253 RepID=A0A7X3CSM2_9BACL|nr:hypothetical protein [Paenibacillus validus]MUG70137.1 hypothetical protein [Paenibacillus validus]
MAKIGNNQELCCKKRANKLKCAKKVIDYPEKEALTLGLTAPNCRQWQQDGSAA